MVSFWHAGVPQEAPLVDDPEVVEVVVRHDLDARRSLAGFLLLVLLVLSITLWGPTWFLHAAQWFVEEVVEPVSRWLTERIDNAPSGVSPDAPGASTPLP